SDAAAPAAARRWFPWHTGVCRGAEVAVRFKPLIRFLAVALFLCPAVSRGEVQVSVDRSASIGASRLELGVTHTHQSTDMSGAKSQAVQRANAIMEQSARWQNTHIIGWGPGDINPEPGV